MKKKKGQTWSIDAFLAISIFLIIITLIYIQINPTPNKTFSLQEKGEFIIKNFDYSTSNIKIINNNEINENNIKKLYGENDGYTYSNIKKRIGLENNFCIYLIDENNQIVEINGAKSFGSNEIEISPGLKCGD